MINNPKSEPYYSYLIRLGYVFCNYSEKHYIFEKDGRVIKVAKSIYNNESTDESYFIERAAHSLLLLYKFPVAKIYNVYPKGEFLKGYVVLEEEKIEGEIYYKKDCAPSYLVQVLRLMQETTKIKGKSFGMMERNGQARFLSWKDFLYSVVDRMPERERAENRCRIEVIPKITESSFIFTDCNMANFVFNMGRLEKAIDIERPLWGDPLFLNGMIKSRNPYMYAFMNQEENSDIVDLYAQLYPYIFNATGKV